MLLGSLEPTFQVAPPAYSNAATEAIEFMAQVGSPLDEWQQDALHVWLGEREDGSWSAFELFLWLQRQNGKGYPMMARELAGLFLFGESLLMHTAHKSETTQQAWKRTLEVVEGSDDLFRRLSPRQGISRKDGEEGLRLRSGAELQFRIRSGRGKGRGLSGNFVGLDEALFLTQDDLDSLGPTMLAIPNAQLMYASTAPLKSDDPIVGVRKRALAGTERMAGMEWVNPPDADVSDPAVLARVNPAYGRRITAERMEDMRRLLGPAGFARECGGIWPDSSSASSIAEKWADLQDASSFRQGDVAIAAEISPTRMMAAVGLYGVRPDGLGHVQLLDYRPGTDWLPERLRGVVDTLDPVGVAMSRAAAASLAPELLQVGIQPSEDPEHPRRGELVPMSASETAAACGQLVDAVRHARLRVAPSPPLDLAVRGAGTRNVGDGIAWTAKDGQAEVSPLGAVTRAKWCYEAREPLVEGTDYDVLDSVY